MYSITIIIISYKFKIVNKTAQYVHDIELHFTEKRTQTRKLKRFLSKSSAAVHKINILSQAECTSGCSENTFLRILYDLDYILHSPKPLLFVCTFQ